MRVKIEDMRDWLRDFYKEGGVLAASALSELETWEDAEIAELYVELKFKDLK